jgi:hypothetical protein
MYYEGSLIWVCRFEGIFNRVGRFLTFYIFNKSQTVPVKEENSKQNVKSADPFEQRSCLLESLINHIYIRVKKIFKLDFIVNVEFYAN